MIDLFKQFLSSSCILLPWLIFSLIYFGSPVPHSVVAKGSTYDFPPLTAAKTLLNYLVYYTLPVGNIELGKVLRYGFMLLLAVLGIVAARRTYRMYQLDVVPFWLFPAVYLAAYAVANPPVWEWYAVPLVPFACITLVTGMVEVLAKSEETRFPKLVIQTGIAALFLLLLVAVTMQSQFIMRNDPRQGRELVYIDLVQKLDDIILPGDTVAAPEIGAIGFFLPNAQILDTQGLVSPQAVPYHQTSSRNLDSVDVAAAWTASSSIPAALIMNERPDYVITLDIFAGLILEHKEFRDAYDLLMSIPSNIFGSESVVVFHHK